MNSSSNLQDVEVKSEPVDQEYNEEGVPPDGEWFDVPIVKAEALETFEKTSATPSKQIKIDKNIVNTENSIHQPIVVVISLEKTEFHKRNFVCSICMELFASFDLLILHKNVHHKSKSSCHKNLAYNQSSDAKTLKMEPFDLEDCVKSQCTNQNIPATQNLEKRLDTMEIDKIDIKNEVLVQRPIDVAITNGGSFTYTAELQVSQENLIKKIQIMDKTKPLTVTEIKSIKFSTLSLKKRVKIKELGRPTPDVLKAQSGTSHNKKYVRAFNSDWYEKKKWLCGCQIRNALFCFPCLLMGGDSVWTEIGFNNLSRMKEKTIKHEHSRRHIDNVVNLSFLGNTNNIECPSELYKLTIIRHNENVKNKKILSKIIDCIKFCGNYELSLRDFDEKDESLDLDVFKGLVNFTANLDSELKLHFCDSLTFELTLKTVQNELLDCMLQVCHEKIAAEINQTSYVSLMVDDITDVSEDMQIAIVFRYELNCEVHERFWGYFNLENQNGDGLSKCILEQIDVVLKDTPSKLISQSFDGASLMRGGKDGVQLSIKRTYDNAHFIHCYLHQLDLIMKHSAITSNSCRLFYTNLLKISIFFSNSAYRLEILNKQINVNLPKHSVTEWNFDIQTVYTNLEIIKKCFEELQSSKQSDDKTITESYALFLTLNNENFLFWLQLFNKITPHVEMLYNQMQCREIDIFSIQKNIKIFKNSIWEIRNSYTEMSRFKEVGDMCDVISLDIEQRYSFNDHLLAAKLFDKQNFKQFQQKMPIEEIDQVIKSYPMLEKERLLTEFQVFYKRVEMHSYNNLLSLLKIIHANHLCDVLEELTKLLKILLTTPMTTAEPERCFSTFKRIKTNLRNTNSQEKLTVLSMLSVEKEMIEKILNFNEQVIEKFVKNKHDFILK